MIICDSKRVVCREFLITEDWNSWLATPAIAFFMQKYHIESFWTPQNTQRYRIYVKDFFFFKQYIHDGEYIFGECPEDSIMEFFTIKEAENYIATLH